MDVQAADEVEAPGRWGPAPEVALYPSDALGHVSSHGQGGRPAVLERGRGEVDRGDRPAGRGKPAVGRGGRPLPTSPQVQAGPGSGPTGQCVSRSNARDGGVGRGGVGVGRPGRSSGLRAGAGPVGQAEGAAPLLVLVGRSSHPRTTTCARHPQRAHQRSAPLEPGSTSGGEPGAAAPGARSRHRARDPAAGHGSRPAGARSAGDSPPCPGAHAGRAPNASPRHPARTARRSRHLLVVHDRMPPMAGGAHTQRRDAHVGCLARGTHACLGGQRAYPGG